MKIGLDPNDDPPIVVDISQIINTHSFNPSAESSHQIRYKIVSERPLLGELTHEHGDRADHRLIDVDDEHYLVIANKHRAPAACRQHCPHLHHDHRFVHKRT